MQLLWALSMMVLPASLRRVVARRALGWDIHRTAYIGRSMIRVRHVSMGPGSVIGPRNVIRGLDRLELAEGASIATRNSITAFPLSTNVFPWSPNRDPSLVMGRFSMITDAHELDCSDRIELGEYAAFAGFRSQILTHSLNLVTDRQTTAPVVLGEHCAVMSGCILLCGTRVPDRAIISAGSVVTTKLTAPQTFYRGNPAEAVRALPDNYKYFHRTGLGPQVPTPGTDLRTPAPRP